MLRTGFAFTVLVLLVAMGLSCPAEAATYRVDVSSTAVSPDGQSWGNAYKTIQSAITAAINAGASSGDPAEIWVADGVYAGQGAVVTVSGTSTSNVVALRQYVHLYGGFAGGETQRSQRDWDSNPTIIDGSSVRRCVINSEVIPAGDGTLDGFTLRSGSVTTGNDSADRGAGLYLSQGSIAVANCRFVSNSTTDGGGAYIALGSPTFEDCEFLGNTAEFNGGGALCSSFDSTMDSCVFEGNSAGDDGGALHTSDSDVIMVNSVFSGNTAGGSGGAVRNTFLSTASFTNCLFFRNNANGAGGGFSNDGSNPTLLNDIVWDNSPDAIDGSGLTVTYSCVEGGYTGTGNINADPVFLGVDNGDLRLHPSSPCAAAGTLTGAPSVDLLDVSRPQPAGAGAVDMGPYETDETKAPGTLTVALTSDPVINTTAAWRVDGGTWIGLGDTIELLPGSYTISYRPVGNYLTPAPVDITLAPDEDRTLQVTYVLSQGANLWYVDVDNGGGTQNGNSWATAYATIQQGINAAANAGGGEVWVAEGTYTSTSTSVITLADGVYLFGGFQGDETVQNERNYTINPSIIDGQSTRRCVSAAGIGKAEAGLNGFLLRNGSSGNSGGAVYLDGASPDLFYCTLEQNSANMGGALYMTASSPLVNGCIFSENDSSGDGGAIYVDASSAPRIVNCLMLDNASGGGFGGGGGALYSRNASPTVMNSTLYGNSASGFNASGGAIHGTSSSIVVTNSIIRNSTPDDIGDNNPVITYSNVETGYAGTNNITDDPVFVDAANGDFHIDETSPCIDKGTSAGAPDTDLDGMTRPQGPGFDMGAYEFTQTGTLIVNIIPQDVIDLGAQWSPWPGVWLDSGQSYELPSGTTHEINFTDIPNWDSPTLSVVLVKDQLTTRTATYVRQTGTVNVDVTPDTASWSFVDGEGDTHTGTGDATETDVPTGTITMTWTAIPGYVTPSPNPDARTLDADGSITFTGNYVRETGTVNVSVTPNTASWSFVDGDNVVHNGTGDATFPDIPTGTITMTWGDLGGYDTPSPNPNTRNLTLDGTVIFVGNYDRQTGTIIVDVTPDAASWSFLDGDGNTQNGTGDATVTDVPTGNITFTWGALPGHITPSPNPETFALGLNATETVSGVYVRQTGTVVVNVSPDSATWSLEDGDGVTQNGTGDATLNNVPTGAITLTWDALTGFTSPSPNPDARTLDPGETETFDGRYNRPPTADAGPDQLGLLNDFITLDGSASSDPDGDELTFEWSFVSRPGGSAAVLSDTTAVSPTFTVDVAGEYVVQLVVNDGLVPSDPDTVTITPNPPPVADAGPDQVGDVGDTIVLDGSGSSDANGDELTFSWSFDSRPQGSTAQLDDPTAVNPSFTIDVAGDYVVQLIVNDGTLDSEPDTVLVTTATLPPVANAGPDQRGQAGDIITLDGSASSDPGGAELAFAWSFVVRPDGSSAQLDDPSSVFPSFTIDVTGEYVIQLIVNNGSDDSAPDTMRVAPQVPPIADAGPEQSREVGDTVILDGSGSYDPDGDEITYAWSFVSRPSGSAAQLDGATTVFPSFAIDVGGQYVVQLIVNDGTLDSEPDTVVVTTTDPPPPTADAGPDQRGQAGDVIRLDGSGSSDPSGRELTFAWSFLSRPTGSTAQLDDPGSLFPSFTIDVTGDYVVQLVVNNGLKDSAPDTMRVGTQLRPVADAGTDQNGGVGDVIVLDGSESYDPDGDEITYAWSFVSRPSGSAAQLDDPTAVSPSFTVDAAGAYVVQLIVNDGLYDSDPDTVYVNSIVPPVADAGANQIGDLNDTIGLDGSASYDLDGDELSYQWSFVSRPAGSSAELSDPTSVFPTFTIDAPGDYLVQLIVNDGTFDSEPDTVLVSTILPPIADAGEDQLGQVGQRIRLDGRNSRDPEGQPLFYSWSFVSRPAGSAATLDDPAAVRPSFVIDQAGNYVIQLIVNDGELNSAPDTVVVGTIPRPVADAGPAQTAGVGDDVTLNGSGSYDPQGNELTYAWTFASRPTGSTATLDDPASVTPTFSVDVGGSYVIQLIVNNGSRDSLPDTTSVRVIVPPVADAGADQVGQVGDTITLDGSGSYDLDGDSLTYQWSFVSRPTGSAAALDDPTAVFPRFDVDVDGDYVIQLVVNDGTFDSAPDSVLVSAVPPPTADAGPDQFVQLNDTVTLDGSGSVGQNLTYQWSFVSRPAGSAAALNDPTLVGPSFTVDVEGDYVIQLVVSDGEYTSLPDTVLVTTEPLPPVADAGEDQRKLLNDTVTLDGSGSFDPGGGTLTYQWSLVSRPAGSTAALNDPTLVGPSFTADVQGNFVAQLIVDNGQRSSQPDTVVITVNRPPVADAGEDQTLPVGSTANLDGSGSQDPDGDPLTFAWSFVSRPAGSTAQLSDAASETPSFSVDAVGDFVVQLVVNDGETDSDPATVTITGNRRPVAEAGDNQIVPLNDTAELDGSGSSDGDGHPLTYAWSFVSRPAGSTATLSGADTAQPTFVVDASGDYVIQLVVNDGFEDSVPDTVTITSNRAPVADAGEDETVTVDTQATLDGSGSSDPDGNELAYAWSFVSRPAGSTAALSGAGTAQPSFTVDVAGDFVVQLIVNDGLLDSNIDTVTITGNTAPVAHAGGDAVRTVGTDVTLNGTTSEDADGDTLTYAWTFVSRPAGSTASLSGADTAQPSFTVDTAGDFVVQLIVNDGFVDSAPDTVTITGNTAPVAHAGGDAVRSVGTGVTLNGTTSEDADGDTLTYAWTFVSRPDGSAASLSGADTVQPSFTVDAAGDFVVQLIVNDGNVDSAPDTVTITGNALPLADAGPDQSVAVGSDVMLDGSGSTDAEGDTLTFAWSLVSRPDGSAAALDNPSAVLPAFSADVAGNYSVQLVVNDGLGNSAPDAVTIIAGDGPENLAPTADAGPDQGVPVGTIVQLDGTNSADDGQLEPLTFAWSITSRPAGSTTVLNDSSSPAPQFVLDAEGDFTLQLIVDDGQFSDSDTVTITGRPGPVNVAPSADAGVDQAVPIGLTVNLDGRGSTDDGLLEPLSFAWSILSRPANSAASLGDSDGPTPSFVADQAGTFVVQLIVNDGELDSAPDTVVITTADELNHAPVADAGPDQSAPVGNSVTLDGTDSSDADGDLLTFAWALTYRPAGSAAALDDSTSVAPSFTLDAEGTYIAQLVVNDGQLASDPDTVVITSGPVNVAPVADAGPDQSAPVGNSVTLDGTGSYDPDGDSLTYGWALTYRPAGSSATLDDATLATPSFTLDVDGVYVAQLVVSDGQFDSAPDWVTVTIGSVVLAPTADAGPDQSVELGETVVLDGTASSDPDSRPLTYSWSITYRPALSAATLTNPNTAQPTFVADAPGDFLFELTVNNGARDSRPDTVVVTVNNDPPVANAGENQTVNVGTAATLDGSGSSDPNGQDLTYQWSVVSSPTGSSPQLDDATAAMPSLTTDRPGVHVVQLIVSDGFVNSDPATVTVTFVAPLPVANAGPDQTVYFGQQVQLDGSGSNSPNGGTLSYLWAFISRPAGSTATLSSTNVANPTFTVDVLGDYVVQLIVGDAYNSSPADTVKVSAENRKPVANAGPDQDVEVEDTVTLDGSGSSDADPGDTLSYAWSLTARPAGSTAALSNAASVESTFVADVKGNYVAQLVVNDGRISDDDTVTVTVGNRAPIAVAGPDQTGQPGELITLDGSESFDPDGDPLTYTWTLVDAPEGSTAELADTTTVSPSFTIDPPQGSGCQPETLSGNYTIQLVVNDGEDPSAPDTVIVTIGEDAGGCAGAKSSPLYDTMKSRIADLLIFLISGVSLLLFSFATRRSQQ